MGVGGLAERVTSGWGGHGAEISCPYLILSLHKLPVPAEYQALCAWLVVSSPQRPLQLPSHLQGEHQVAGPP